MIPVIKLVCQKCGRDFDVNPEHFAQLGFKNLPKRCPRCVDEIQRRPSIVQERVLLNVYDGLEIVSLPGAWEECQGSDKDVAAYKMTVRGSRYGACWSGRIDLFALRSFAPGDIVSIREMEVKHLVKEHYESRGTIYGTTVTITTQLPVTSEDPDAGEVVRTRRYLVLEPWDGPAFCRLVWAEARTKTTLKGLGRQYWAELSGAPIAQWRVTGGYRSGRAHTTGVLAIVSDEHPLYVVKTGAIQGEEVYK